MTERRLAVTIRDGSVMSDPPARHRKRGDPVDSPASRVAQGQNDAEIENNTLPPAIDDPSLVLEKFGNRYADSARPISVST